MLCGRNIPPIFPRISKPIQTEKVDMKAVIPTVNWRFEVKGRCDGNSRWPYLLGFGYSVSLQPQKPKDSAATSSTDLVMD